MTKAIEASIATCEAHYERPLKNWEITALQAAITASLANTDGGEIVERLRGVDHGSVEDCFLQSPLFDHAADHITKLTAQLTGAIADGYDLAKEEYRERIEELEALLEPFAEVVRAVDRSSDHFGLSHRDNVSDDKPYRGYERKITWGHMRAAARALTAKGE